MRQRDPVKPLSQRGAPAMSMGVKTRGCCPMVRHIVNNPLRHFWYCCAMVQMMVQKLVFAGICLLALSSPAIAADFQRSAPVHLDRDGEKWAQKTLKKLSLEEKIGQMFMVRLTMPQFANVRNP